MAGASDHAFDFLGHAAEAAHGTALPAVRIVRSTVFQCHLHTQVAGVVGDVIGSARHEWSELSGGFRIPVSFFRKRTEFFVLVRPAVRSSLQLPELQKGVAPKR
jgi:hypothetical protein